LDNTAYSQAKTGSEGDPPSDGKPDWLEVALRAAETGNPAGMLEALHNSRVLDGLVRHVRHRWDDLDEDDAENVVAESVDALYANASKGGKIRQPAAYLFKVAMNLAQDRYEAKIQHDPFDDENEVHNREPQHSRTADRDQLRTQALAIARRLLPLLGQENMQLVMTYYLDAVEKRIAHVSTEEVAEALGLSPETVRQHKSRGFRRLKRVAREQGIKLEDTLVGDRANDEQTEGEDYEH